jgi:muconate/chloromuconate cycloisomerase
MKVDSVETYRITIPMKPENLSFGRVDRVQYVIVRVSAGDLDGWGEAATLQGPTWSEESQESIHSVIENYLSKIVVKQDTRDYYKILRLMDQRVRGNSFAKAALEMALIDAYCKELHIPVCAIWGSFRSSVPLSWTIANNDEDLDADEASQMVKKGWKILKVKVGSLPVETDLKRIKRIREAVGDEVSLRVDANQGWRYDQALSIIHELNKLKVDLLEQPLPKQDLQGMSLIASNSEVPIMADESVTELRDAVGLICCRGSSVFSYKLTKMGGLTKARSIYEVAFAHGISSYVGCMIETSVGTAAYLHFAASLPELEYGCELFGPLRLHGDVAKKPVAYGQGEVFVPKGEGLGVDVDQKKLSKFVDQ